MAANAPKTPVSRADRTRQFLLYGFGVSLLLHLIFVPLIPFKRGADEPEKKQVIAVETKKPVKVVTPKPTPTPPPVQTPTPSPHTPPPDKNTPPPETKRLLVQPPKTTNNSNSGQGEKAYVAPKSGSQEGVPAGNSDKGPATAAPPTSAPPTPTSVPPPTPTPPPKCANPNVQAVAVEKADAVVPEIARQQGATGVATVRVNLSATGSVVSATIAKSTSNQSLDRAAIDAAKQSRYTPDIVNCEKQAGSYLFVVEFVN